MKRCIKKAVSALVFSSFMVSSVVSVAAYDVSYTGGNSDFRVSGKVGTTAGQIVTLKVEDSNPDVLYTRQTETNASGEYSFVFNIDDSISYGNITVKVNEGNSSTESKSFYKSDNDQISRALTKINTEGILALSGTDDAAEVGTGADIDDILQVDAAEFAAGSLMASHFSGKTFADISAFNDTYKKGKFFVELAKTAPTADNDELYRLMKECGAEELLGDISAAEIFEGYSADEQKEILAGIKGKTYANDESFKKAVVGAIVVNEIPKASTNNAKWAVISENNSVLGLALNTYESSATFETLKSQLFALTISSFDTLKSEVARIYGELNPLGGGGDGFGGFGGGTGGGTGGNDIVSVGSGFVTPPESAVTLGFSDLDGYDWARDAILTLTADGIVNGKGEGKFAPGDYVTRAEFTKIIMGAFNLVAADDQVGFSDVPKSHWSYKYVASAAKSGIVNGVSETTFNPEGRITRQDMAAICYRVLKGLNLGGDSQKGKTFKDGADVSDYAKEAVDMLSGLGIINGKGDGIFAPMDFATRAEAAKIIHSLRKMG